MFCDLTCCAQMRLFVKILLGLIKNRSENIMIHRMWTMFVNHENLSGSITKSSYVGKSAKLLANSSILVSLHGNSGSSHAYIQVCAFKNANDAGITSAASSWSLVAQQEILHVCCEIDNV